MAKKLTAGVLQGTSFIEVMGVEWQGEKFEIEIKPLNNTQASQIETLIQEGISLKAKPGMKGKMERNMDFDMKKNTMGRFPSDLLAVALGTVDESLTEDVIEREFPRKLVKEIADRVKRISGIANQQEIEEFNEDKEEPRESSGEQ